VKIVDAKTVKLVAVDGHVLFAGKFPFILLVHGNAHQVRHYFRQAVVMVAFHPHHFFFMFGIGKLADVPQKFPMVFGQAAEVEIGKDIAQQDETPEVNGAQEIQRILGPADLGSQVEIRNYDRIVRFAQHAL